MRYYLILISAMLLACTASSQSENDTTVREFILPAMEVTASAGNDSSNALINREEQLLLYGVLLGQDMGVLLDRSGAAFVNVTGPPGSSSSARFAGYSSDHSLFFWNGVPLNSLSLGTCDLSLMPVLSGDQAVVYRNAAVSELPAGGPGMNVNLQSGNRQHADGAVLVRSSMNSIRNSTFSLEQFHCVLNDKSDRTCRLSVRSRLVLHDMKNEFLYRDVYMAEQPVMAQQHNNARSMALMNDVFFKSKFGDLSFHHWLGKRSASLPSVMGRYTTGRAEQMDEINRALLCWNLKKNKLDVNISGASFRERLLYRDLPMANDQWLIHSDVNSSSYMLTSSARYRVFRSLSLGLHAVIADQTVHNTSYANGNAKINWWQTGASVSYQPKQWKVLLDFKQDSRIRSNGPSASLALAYSKVFNKFTVRPQLTFSRKFRSPDMNELYWVPGGNRNLLPESSFTANIGSEFILQLQPLTAISIAPSLQFSNVTNWIQWIPSNMGYWLPVNLKQVESRVFELPLTFTTTFGKYKVFSESRWLQTKSEQFDFETMTRKKMIYTPEHTCASALGFGIEQWDVACRYRYTSERFTDELNSGARALPAYSVAGVLLKYSNATRRMNYSLCLDIDNLFDVRYESVRAYAIPGRVFTLQLTCQFLTIQTNKIHEE